MTSSAMHRSMKVSISSDALGIGIGIVYKVFKLFEKLSITGGATAGALASEELG